MQLIKVTLWNDEKSIEWDVTHKQYKEYDPSWQLYEQFKRVQLIKVTLQKEGKKSIERDVDMFRTGEKINPHSGIFYNGKQGSIRIYSGRTTSNKFAIIYNLLTSTVDGGVECR